MRWNVLLSIRFHNVWADGPSEIVDLAFQHHPRGRSEIDAHFCFYPSASLEFGFGYFLLLVFLDLVLQYSTGVLLLL